MKPKHSLLILLFIVLSCVGCVRRRMTIRSNPPGATVYVDKQEIGQTPVSTNFIYYGTREIKLVHPGYQTLTVQEKISPPWYQITPLDFISENLYPREIRDERILEFELEPARIIGREELVNRGSELRSATRAGFTVPTVPDSFRNEELQDSFERDYDIPPEFYPEQ